MNTSPAYQTSQNHISLDSDTSNTAGTVVGSEVTAQRPGTKPSQFGSVIINRTGS